MDDHAPRSAVVETLPARFYRDRETFAFERETVFRRTWQLIGRETDLAEPGDYLADEIGGAPILAVRGHDRTLRAFHNLCRHRAGPLVTEPRGSCGKHLVCGYHGWRYELDGRLRAATDFGPAEGFDPRNYGLVPVRVDVWRGLVFVNLDLEAIDLATAMASLDRAFDRRGVELPPQFVLGRSYELGCDWKVYMENFLEGYHLPSVHPGLKAEVDVGRYSVSVDDDVAVQEAFALDNVRGANQGLWIWMWPNLGISLFKGGLMIERVSPIGFRRTRLDYFYFHDFGSGVDFDNVLQVSTRTTSEDIVICEQVQKRLDGGIYERGVLSPHHEAGVAAFQARIRQVHELKAA